MIEIRNLCKSFRGRTVLNNVSFSIAERELVCLIGSIGSGKSTILRCLSGLEKPDSGEICFTGAGDKPRVGLVFQRFNLFPHLNVLHNLTLAPIQVLGLSPEQAEQIALEQLNSVGMGHKSHLFPHELSMGQQQRVAIARCLAMNPQVLLLDEPLSALDPIAAGEVMDVLRKLKKEITLVMITHNLTAAAELADRVIFLNDGQIGEQGTTEQVLSSPEQEATRHFLSRLKNLHYEIDPEQFDRPELNARIEQYCNRFGLGGQAFRRVQLVVEEMLNLVPMQGGVYLMLSKSENQVRMSIDVTIPDTGVSILDEATCPDELSLSLLQGLCDLMQESVEGAERTIHLEINQEQLLIK